jgi:DNA-binding transcriptional ArsR family regulator
MRPPTRPTSFFYHPLDAMLGTPAGVRILRVLSLHRDVMSAAMIAERTGLGAAGAGRALKRLLASRVIETVGDPRRPQYQLAQGNQMIAEIRTLFEAEAQRTDDFMRRLRKAARNVDPPPQAIWLIGSVARREDSMLSDLDVAMVWSGAARPGLKLFNQGVREAAGELGLNVSILTLAVAEVQQHASADDAWWRNLAEDAVPILGPAPGHLING